MKYLKLSILSCVLLLGCNPQEAVQKENVAIIESYIQAVENNDYEIMESLLADEYVGVGPSVSDTTNREMALATWRKNSDELYESINYTKSRTFPISVSGGDYPGEWVTNFAFLTIKYKNGDQVQLLANTSYKIENSKIINSFTFYNEADAFDQLGYVFIDLDELYDFNN